MEVLYVYISPGSSTPVLGKIHLFLKTEVQ